MKRCFLSSIAGTIYASAGLFSAWTTTSNRGLNQAPDNQELSQLEDREIIELSNILTTVSVSILQSPLVALRLFRTNDQPQR